MKKKETILTGAIIIIAIYTLTVTLVSQAFPAVESTKTLSSSGTIVTVGVGVYTSPSCSTPVTAIPWGALEPGESQNFVCYIRNEGSTPTTLSMYTSNWSPSAASNYLSLSWDYAGETINPDAVIQVTFTLTVSESITGITTFSFDITIVGSG